MAATTCVFPGQRLSELCVSDCQCAPVPPQCGTSVACAPFRTGRLSMRTTGRVASHGRLRKCLARMGLLGVAPRRCGCCSLVLHASEVISANFM